MAVIQERSVSASHGNDTVDRHLDADQTQEQEQEQEHQLQRDDARVVVNMHQLDDRYGGVHVCVCVMSCVLRWLGFLCNTFQFPLSPALRRPHVATSGQYPIGRR